MNNNVNIIREKIYELSNILLYYGNILNAEEESYHGKLQSRPISLKERDGITPLLHYDIIVGSNTRSGYMYLEFEPMNLQHVLRIVFHGIVVESKGMQFYLNLMSELLNMNMTKTESSDGIFKYISANIDGFNISKMMEPIDHEKIKNVFKMLRI